MSFPSWVFFTARTRYTKYQGYLNASPALPQIAFSYLMGQMQHLYIDPVIPDPIPGYTQEEQRLIYLRINEHKGLLKDAYENMRKQLDTGTEFIALMKSDDFDTYIDGCFQVLNTYLENTYINVI